MLSRRWFVAVTVWGMSLLLGPKTRAQDNPPTTGDADLRETLTFGLRPRTPEETAFIELVIAKVAAKVLPLELVISTFRWAEGRPPYPMPHFQRALIIRAAKLGISLS